MEIHGNKFIKGILVAVLFEGITILGFLATWHLWRYIR
jgi:F0F1-type ATP synthase membrane subunit c/vacuolar-type H+-ATPase subunit K